MRICSSFPSFWRCIAIFFVVSVISDAPPVFAQQTRIAGKVSEVRSGAPLPGTRISLQGTTRIAFADARGDFSLVVPSLPAALEIRRVGYKKKTLLVAQAEPLSITLEPDASRSGEVVVTAMGIEREKSALGYAVERIGGDELTDAREPNLAASLAGKVAGLQVNMNASGAGSSSRVVIRGTKALANDQSSQPLYVVDGVPIDNSSPNQPSKWGGVDFGDGVSAVNPDDIESITVLKGSGAALYGARAQNGVILISTKKGGARQGIGVEYNGNAVWETPLVLFDFQNEYGHGSYGKTPATASEALAAGTSSWGAKMDGQPAMFYDGVTRPLTPQPDNLKNFYQTGRTFTNTLAVSGGNEWGTFRFSASQMDNAGVVPESFLKRNTFTAHSSAALSDKLSASVKVTYLDESSNRTPIADQANPGRALVHMARSVDTEWLKTYKSGDTPYISFSNDAYNPNPYFSVYECPVTQTTERWIMMGQASYQISDELSAQARLGRDFRTQHQLFAYGIGIPFEPSGMLFGETTMLTQETNADFLLTFRRALDEETHLTLNAGAATMNRSMERSLIGGSGFILPGIYSASNLKNKAFDYSYSQKRINSVYASAQISYKDLLFGEATARNDWSSTLPPENASYFYPSVNASFILSKALRLPEEISYAALRASWAQVGGDADPYQLSLTYRVIGSYQQPRGSTTLAASSGVSVPLADLKPTRATTIELGAEWQFFDGRAGVDITYYRQVIGDQILSVDVSQTTGFFKAAINAGEIRNSGVELVLRARAIETASFKWDAGLNLARNYNEVTALVPGLETLLLEDGRNLAQVVARVGEPSGVIIGRAFKRDAQGRVLYTTGGMPTLTNEYLPLGNATPKLLGGFENTFSVGNLSLSVLFDFRFGGQMFSYSNAIAYRAGNHKATLEGRETGVVGDGVLENGQPNTKRVAAQDYYGTVGRAAEPFVYDASFIKFREARLSFALPDEWLGGVAQKITLSIVGRNLAFLLNRVPGVDPQTSYTNNNGQGLETATYPTTRSVGFNVRLVF